MRLEIPICTALLVAVGLGSHSSSDAHRQPRATGVGERACKMLFAVDEPLWELKGRNASSLIDMARRLVDRLNDLFSGQVFEGSFGDVFFRLSRVQVVFGSCVGPGFKNCTEQRGLFLSSFDGPRDFSDFCLAYLFTFRDFRNGTAGLASVGTACRKAANSGFVTMLNYGQERSFEETAVTFAHEVAHNFNASHDNDWMEARPECVAESYIMSDSFSFDAKSRPQFSPCSVDSMKLMLKELTEKRAGCFSHAPAEEVELAICGNGVVEPGEECDCGEDEFTCHDPCCYPARITEEDKETDEGALSCTVHTKWSCLTPPPLIFGIYLPLAAVLIGTVIVALVLRRDWRKSKTLFHHVTEGNVRIVRPGQVQPAAR